MNSEESDKYRASCLLLSRMYHKAAMTGMPFQILVKGAWANSPTPPGLHSDLTRFRVKPAEPDIWWIVPGCLPTQDPETVAEWNRTRKDGVIRLKVIPGTDPPDIGEAKDGEVAND